MISDQFIELWSAQHKRVFDTIQNEGVYYVKNRYLEEKYQEVSWVFKEAYAYMVKEVAKRVPKPPEAESPVWFFNDKNWALKDEDTVLLKIELPREEVVLFDLHKWNKVLNLSYVGTETEEKEFSERLKRNGVHDSTEIFTRPYYPLEKKEIVKSWSRIFELDNTAGQHIQGAAWKLEKASIKEIIY